jgi:hypothetical protein
VIPQAGGAGTIAAGFVPTLNQNTTGTAANLSGTPTVPNGTAATSQSQNDNSTKLATTAYTDLAVANGIAGVNPAVAVLMATTQASDTSGLTYANGASGVGATFTGTANTAITWDGVAFTAVGQCGLVKNDTQSPSGAFNGIYCMTVLQASLVAPVLTRRADYNQPSNINSTGAIPVISGTLNATTSWLLTSSVTTVGTSALTYVRFSVSPATQGYNLTSTYTAGGTIAAGTLVSLTSSNTVQQGLPIAFGPLANLGTVFSGGSANSFNTAPLGTGKFALVYKDANNAAKLTAVVCSYSGSPVATSTCGTPVLVPTNGGTGTTQTMLATPNITPLGIGGFAVVYPDSTNTNKITTAAATVSGTALTWGTQVLVPTSGGTGTTSPTGASIHFLDSSDFLVEIVDTTNGTKPTFVSASVTGSTISYNTQVAATGDVNPIVSNYPFVVLSATSFVFFTNNSSATGIAATAGSISSGVITLGSNTTIQTSFTGQSVQQPLGSAGAVTCYTDNVSSPVRFVCTVVSVSGTTVTVGSEASVPTFSGVAAIQPAVTPALQSLDATHYAVLFNDSTNGTKQTVAVASVSGVTSTFGLATQVGTSNASSTQQIMVALDSSHLAIVVIDTARSSTWQSIIGLVSGTSISFSGKVPVDFPLVSTAAFLFLQPLSSTQFLFTDGSSNFTIGTFNVFGSQIGVASAVAASSASVPVITSGLAKGVFSGLTPGVAYYAQGDGTISTTQSGVQVGYAINTTDMLIASLLATFF